MADAVDLPEAKHAQGVKGSGTPDPLKSEPKHAPVNKPVFITSAAIIVAFVIWAAIWPDQADTAIFGSMDWIGANLGWYYVVTVTLVVIFVLVVALTRVGRVKMGPDHSKPRYNLFTWASMLFAAGIGVDLMFFGISGPATNFLTPPEGAGLSDEAARMAPLWTMFHYGTPGWALYALMGMGIGLFAYRYHMPLSIRSALAPIFGKRVKGAPGHAVDVAAVLGTIFGIAVSLGIGVVFLNYGLSHIFGLPQSMGVQIALMVLAVGITIISTVTGVDKGIRRLSELNVLLAVAMMLWVLVSGETPKLMNQLVQNIGDYFSRLPSMLMNTFGYTDGDPSYSSDAWMQDWTLFFWAWWIAWAAFVGLFLARISRGRTLRQFILGVLLIPLSYIILWISIFGNGALAFFRAGDEEFLNTAISNPESGFFNLLLEYPGQSFSIGLAVVTGLLFYVTSADSGSLVMANLTSKPSINDSDGAPWLRIFWAVVTGALTLAMLFIDGVYTLQAATVVIGLPFSIVIYLMMISLYKVLRTEGQSFDSKQAAMPGVLSSIRDAGGKSTWKQRLRRRMSFATADQTTKFINEVATPAVEEVAQELTKLGANVTCHRGEHPDYPIPYVDLLVRFANQDEFKYQPYPVAYNVPNYASNMAAVKEIFFKVEVFTLTGSQGKDIMGYTGDQIIADILDAYDAHVLYMSMIGDKGSPSGIVEVNVPDEWTDSDQVDTETSTIPTVSEQTSSINDPTTRNDQGGADHER
ncbi:MAG: choline BCCT transporter BetT [Yaniella sp.]|uniref:choline BCCT transporter BetT n=1 Tax=Yaniella sp. TaxID=2773929 RepID=UPI002648AD50|nr:choline BCCT transporter BetT [Yaniella sp.]MDN5704521.1 choline BCCT transporter BetT [Yaniella sp.]MDN5742798.1 choline BCCT transporter BetT [Yaniella sp.]MDN5815798.1 choline BCCT transporter BetT [Yaniella sp.]MDN5817730.1 choline BCCT transporter BetT [Yaniella sp.]MDN5837625.1 choline BCCT transporter BetT [Yaniella sp.]